MTGHLRKRAFVALTSIFGASILAFIILRIAPGDPARQVLGPFATQQQLQAFRQGNSLDKPLWFQYWAFIRNFFSGNWGFSYSQGTPVRTLFAKALPATLELAVVTFVLATAAAVLMALLVTYRRRPWLDRAANGVAFFSLGAPPFWVGLLLILLLSQRLHLLPGVDGQISADHPVTVHTNFLLIDTLIDGDLSGFWLVCQHLVLPVLTLGLAVWGYLFRILRVSLLEVGQLPFVLAVEAKGVSRWSAFTRHALHNALLPTLTASGLVLGQLLAGSVLVEAVFAWPGAGNLVVTSITQKDYSVVDVFVMLSATAYVLINFVVDALHLLADPRVAAAEGVS